MTCLFLVSQGIVTAQNETDTIKVPAKATVLKLTVGLKVTPPFIIKEKGKYTGVCIDLWESVAQKLGVVYEYKEFGQSEIKEMLTATENGSIDLCINPLTVTSERIKRVDFTQPFFMSSLAVAVPRGSSVGFISILPNLFSLKFITAILLLATVLLVFGVTVWLVEKKKNPEQFRPGIFGIGDGIWWAASTMTTVGYGDKAPRSFIGRVFGIVWMFTAILVISSLTGSIAASLTASELSSDIKSINDLSHKHTGTIAGTGSDAFLLRNKIAPYKSDFKTIPEAIHALDAGIIDAFVYDRPVFDYYASHEDYDRGIAILPKKLSIDYFSFAAQKGSPLLPKINPIMIQELEKISWLGVLGKYNLSK